MVFTKHPANPLLDIGAGGTWESGRVYENVVLYRNNKWYMYYSGVGVGGKRIGLATSVDGINWIKESTNPILDKGAGGTWDDVFVYDCSVLYRNHKWYMYYTGYDGAAYSIGLATSVDGITWTKCGANPVLEKGAGGTWDDARVIAPNVLYRNNKWYMYYTGYGVTNYKTGLATSVDGITWTKHGANPVLEKGAGGTWDGVYVYEVSVLYRNNKWYIYYSGYGGTTYKTGLATSVDGITWTKYPTNPVLDIGAGGTWDDAHVYEASVLYRNNKWYMYYSGHDGTTVRIGLATSPTGV